MTHKDRALKEMMRVVRPGGRVVVLEFSRCWKIFKPFYDLYSFKLMPWLGQKIAGDAESGVDVKGVQVSPRSRGDVGQTIVAKVDLHEVVLIPSVQELHAERPEVARPFQKARHGLRVDVELRYRSKQAIRARPNKRWIMANLAD